MKIIHICDGWERSNGAANIARMIAAEQEKAGHEVRLARWASIGDLRSSDQTWVHCGWKQCLWWAVMWGRDVHWMPEASYDPVRLGFHGWKKSLAGPFERFFLRKADVAVATCEAEAEWIRAYEPRVKKIEITDIKRFFKLDGQGAPECAADRPLHLMYMGRRHPLKGLEYLEAAVKGMDGVELRVVSNAFGEEKEKAWEWCDVLVLPTLSENFGLVVAEALERGRRVIVTDGAPAWGDGNDYGGRLVYLKGFLGGSDDERVELIGQAVRCLGALEVKSEK